MGGCARARGRRRTGASARSCSVSCATGCLQHSVSHATALTVEDYVFNDANLSPIGAADFGTDDLAALDVSSARVGSCCR